MAIKFQIKGTAIQANYAAAFGNGVQVSASGHPAVVSASGAAGAFGGSVIDISNDGSGVRPLLYMGADNGPLSSGAMTFLMRIVPSWTGNPTSSQSLFASSASQNYQNGFGLGISTGGQLYALFESEVGLVIFNGTIGSTALTFVAGQATDIWVVWDGTTAANAIKVYQAQAGSTAAIVDSATAASAISSRSRQGFSNILLSNSTLFSSVDFTVNEFVIFDTAENPVSYGTRVGFLTAPANNFEGYLSTDPGSTNVRSSVAYTASGIAKTGSAHIPAASDVLYGVATDGTTGTYAAPANSDVRQGVTNGAGTGTLDVPQPAVVLQDFVYDGGTKTGSLQIVIGGGGAGALVTV